MLTLGPKEHLNYLALVRFLRGVRLILPKNRPATESLGRSAKMGQLAAQDYCCPDCGKEFLSNNKGSFPSATTEHVIPYTYGSTCSQYNAILLCASCNKKRAMLSHEDKLKIIEDHYGKIDYSLIPVIVKEDCHGV